MKTVGQHLDYLGDAYINLYARRYITETYPFLPKNCAIQVTERLMSNKFLADLNAQMGFKRNRIFKSSKGSRKQGIHKDGSNFEYNVCKFALVDFEQTYQLLKKLFDLNIAALKTPLSVQIRTHFKGIPI